MSDSKLEDIAETIRASYGAEYVVSVEKDQLTVKPAQKTRGKE